MALRAAMSDGAADRGAAPPRRLILVGAALLAVRWLARRGQDEGTQAP